MFRIVQNRTAAMSAAARTMIFALAGASLNAGALAQVVGPVVPVPKPHVGGPPFIEAWVDPCNGQDTAAPWQQVGRRDMPFLTLNAAIQEVSNAGASAANPGLVHADPGVYGPVAVGGNGEFLPVQMLDFVHVQGVGAKQCVIRGDQTQPSSVFWPVPQDGVCDCGIVGESKEVLVTYLSTYDPSYEEMIDGFTFQGGDVQVYVESEISVAGRISNCVFDMLDYKSSYEPSPSIGGPTFGILSVHSWHPSTQYEDNPINVLHNTFIQGWAPHEIDWAVIAAKPESVAICDVNNPFCYLAPWGDDPNHTLRGVGNPNIQNNLIRFVKTQPRTALLGIDDTDTRVAQGTVLGPSNAFDPNMVGGMDITMTFCSMIIDPLGNPGTPPVPKVNPNPATGGVDPAFIGELLTSLGGLPLSQGRDWRILPDSALVNAGSAPTGGQLRAVNGTAYIVPSLLPMSSTDYDGEVYGNPRRSGPQPDIGFDEFHTFINCGYGNDSASHATAASCPVLCQQVDGNVTEFHLFSGAGAYTLHQTLTLAPYSAPLGAGPPPGFYWAYTTLFGTVVPPLGVLGFPGGFNMRYMQNASSALTLVSTPFVGAAVTPFGGYVPPFDTTPHAFGFALYSAPIGACLYMNEQTEFTPTGGAALYSNLQSFYSN